VARNRGWRAARAPLVAFTDDDCRPSEAWLERLLAAASGDRVVQGRTQPDPLDADSLGPFAKTVVIEEPSLHYETCNILYPRAVLDRLDGFDEAYPAPAGEDTDLGQRSAADGVDRVFSPDALVYHAVHDQSRKQALKGILIAAAGVQTYKANPSLRAHLTYRVFYRRSHPLWLQAVLAVYLIRKSPLAGLFTLPYLAHLLNRVRTTGGSPADVPFMVLLDTVEIGATAVGAVRHRTPLI
jgi:GT2 family glycosyltransferase